MPGQTQLKLVDVAIGYGKAILLKSINLELHRGDFLGIVGPNGAGKSTLLKVMLRILAPISGSVWTSSDLKIGYVPQRSSLDPIFPLTAYEVVNTGVGRRRATLKKRADFAMKQVGIEHLAAIPFRDLSGGQQQRVLMARALARKPDIFILDEPTAGMDLPSESTLLNFLKDLNRSHGLTVVLVAHQIALVAGAAGRIAFVNKDRNIFALDAAQNLLTDEKLSEIYQYPITTGTCHGQVCVHASHLPPGAKQEVTR